MARAKFDEAPGSEENMFKDAYQNQHGYDMIPARDQLVKPR